jgi:hypothetical protein
VTVGGRPLGQTPIRVTDLPQGTHQFALEKAGHEVVEGRLVFALGKNVLISHTLDSSAGLLLVRTRPEGATVELDGEEIGLTPIKRTDLEPGIHSLRVSKDGYSSAFRQYDTSGGDKIEFSARLFEDAAQIVIRTGLEGATVRVEGVLVGTGSKVKLGAVQRGKYGVVVDAPGMHETVGQLVVPTSGRLSVRVKLSPDAQQGKVTVLPPLTRRWGFWAVVGVAGAATVPAGIAVVTAMQPEEQPTGDFTVIIP